MDEKINLNILKNTAFYLFFEKFLIYSIVTILVFVFGATASIYFSDFTFLSRSGALITLVAIHMAYRDFSINISNLNPSEVVELFGKEKVLSFLLNSLAEKSITRIKNESGGYLSKSELEGRLLSMLQKLEESQIMSRDEYLEKRLKEILSLAGRELRLLELKLLGFGTLLWAFADLLNEIFY